MHIGTSSLWRIRYHPAAHTADNKQDGQLCPYRSLCTLLVPFGPSESQHASKRRCLLQMRKQRQALMEPKTFGDYLGAWQQTHEGGCNCTFLPRGLL